MRRRYEGVLIPAIEALTATAIVGVLAAAPDWWAFVRAAYGTSLTPQTFLAATWSLVPQVANGIGLGACAAILAIRRRGSSSAATFGLSIYLALIAAVATAILLSGPVQAGNRSYLELRQAAEKLARASESPGPPPMVNDEPNTPPQTMSWFELGDPTDLPGSDRAIEASRILSGRRLLILQSALLPILGYLVVARLPRTAWWARAVLLVLVYNFFTLSVVVAAAGLMLIAGLWKMRWHSLLEASPLAYAAAYFGLVPLFAAIYWMMPGDFAQTTARYESGAIEVRNVAMTRVSEFVERWLADLPRSIGPDREGHSVVALEAGNDSVTAYTLLYWNTKPRLVIEDGAPIEEVTTMPSFIEWRFRMPRRVRVYGGASYSVTIANVPNWVILEGPKSRSRLDSGNRRRFWHVSGVFSGVREGDDPEGESVVISGTADVPVGVHRALDDFYRLQNGQPIRANLGIGRFLFLSAAVVSSSSFGDMVPITGAARAIVTLEALAGIVLVGLFLNSIAQRVRRPLRTA
jgi:hypothetical protein